MHSVKDNLGFQWERMGRRRDGSVTFSRHCLPPRISSCRAIQGTVNPNGGSVYLKNVQNETSYCHLVRVCVCGDECRLPARPYPGEACREDDQIVKELKKDSVNVESTELNDGQEKDPNEKKNIANAIINGWVQPAMVPVGHFKKTAGEAEAVVLNNKVTTNASAVPKVKPSMIPHGGFNVRAKGMPKPSGLYKPEKMVEHGVLAKLAEGERKDPEKDDEIKELREKAAKVRSKQEGPACQDMETYLKLARKYVKKRSLQRTAKLAKALSSLSTWYAQY